jgi:hypothetical protein
MIYEHRTYTCIFGAAPKLRERFKIHALNLFKKHGIKVISFWELESKHPSGQFIYVCQFNNIEEMNEAWNSFSSDPKWEEVKLQTEKNGPLIKLIESKILTQVEFFEDKYQIG